MKKKNLNCWTGNSGLLPLLWGYYNPWIAEHSSFWSLKKIPVVWIDLVDLNPKEKAPTQKYVLRVVTKSHPWGYQRVRSNTILSVLDRKHALDIFRQNSKNDMKSYLEFDSKYIFPYDAYLPVPLSFLIEAVKSDNWKNALLKTCEENLSEIKTRYSDTSITYIEKLKEILFNKVNQFAIDEIIKAVRNLNTIEIPAIRVKKEVLISNDNDGKDDPTLFVRLNSSGTRISGEELIYSIYKASFPETKELVECIEADFLPPSLVISLIVRLIRSDIKGGYPNQVTVNDFRKLIQEDVFREKLNGMILEKRAETLFKQAIKLLKTIELFNKNDTDQKHNTAQIPHVLVKGIIRQSPDLFLMLLQWLRLKNGQAIGIEVEKKIMATITSLSWFGTNNAKYTQSIWEHISDNDNFWSKEMLKIPFFKKQEFIMYPLIRPANLRMYLVEAVVEKSVKWQNLYPVISSLIFKTYESVLNRESEPDLDMKPFVNGMWDAFINRLFRCRQLVLFAQRDYINENFGDFNQMETLEDTNTPWDWDHIYPSDWVYSQRKIDQNTRHWNNSIGNLRALELGLNRSQKDNFFPKSRLFNTDFDARKESFIREDWEFWDQIESKIYEYENEKIRIHLSAIIHRFCNIYEEWYNVLDIGSLFGFEENIDMNDLKQE